MNQPLTLVESEIVKCIVSRCGACLSSCPVYSIKGLAPYSMRGRLTTIYGINKGLIKGTPFFRDTVASCTLCGLCELNCPPGINLIKVMEALRSESVKSLGLNPLHEKLIIHLRSKGHPYSNPALLNYYVENPESEVAYFPGCTTIFKLPHIMQRTTTLLRMMLGDRIAIVYGCCGGVAKRIGMMGDFNNIKQRIEDLISRTEIKELIVSCAGCYSTITKHYNLGKIKVKHVSVFLRGLSHISGLLPRTSNSREVAYHDPCHLGRHSNIYEEPRYVITNLAGMKLVEFKENREESMCCGGGGGLMSAFPELARQIALNKLKRLLKLNINRLVTTCPFCELNFKEAARSYNLNVEVLDIVETLP
ncbi:MAG: (Fe-S)-binding protein [Candidatus Nezhaarchaeota archaeon]|nr:(Fe-S)-binding protein [Candidatus Nezhaarchaeota archaeon]MCX8142010.1 (Fe-S)-binding protein [Candidatus Nezhaarchaeota archaeon]MDW8050209.1 (Fe-S)-binding protein [Nitrososphaerota archaeon]